MDASLAAAVAVIGTLLGAAATHLFTLRERKRSERFEQTDRRRTECLTVCAELAQQLTHFRGIQNKRRQMIEAGQENTGEYAELKAEADRTRTSSSTSLFRLRLLGAEPDLVALATQAREKTITVRRAHDNADGHRRSEESRTAVDAFVEEAARHLKP